MIQFVCSHYHTMKLLALLLLLLSGYSVSANNTNNTNINTDHNPTTYLRGARNTTHVPNDSDMGPWAQQQEKQQQRHERILGDVYDGISEIYNAGDVRNFNAHSISKLLNNHKYVAFTKQWRGTSRLVLTTRCWLSGGKRTSTGSSKHTQIGAYYCVEGQSVCITVNSMNRFYGNHVGGGNCDLLPLDDNVVENELSDTLQTAYTNTCNDEGKCDGR